MRTGDLAYKDDDDFYYIIGRRNRFAKISGIRVSLNDIEFSRIKKISNEISEKVLILFWQFTIKTLGELDIVSNQNLSVEMLLIRLIFLNSFKSDNRQEDNEKMQEKFNQIKNDKINLSSDSNNEVIDQIKNITQEKKIKPEAQINYKSQSNLSIDTF